ncbi:iron chelate uptake ABC transporter family permease subunit [Pseudoflavonifractor sp. MSJ-37]|uniref:iron chelate uptake ABC transporter family permease subunit n=1 Tax=Pseudoflavonifractor sp. MSJ-37 TaxID=2841531 RepID=UPI001C0F3E1E|nr:iron chelate uptake ABC transporter family permease subunit [Pseudoflavonifractor sp. MSJ-37]
MRPNRQIRSGALYPVLILVLIGTMAAWAANTEVALFDIRLPRIAAAALVGWVGLVIPHVARALCGSNYQRLIPTSALVGAVFLVLMDDIARCVFAVEVPLGILTGSCGGQTVRCCVALP